MEKKVWEFQPKANEEQLKELHEKGTIPIPLCHALSQIGVQTFEQVQTFFNPKSDQLHDPFEMLGMEKAVSRIQKAIETGEKIMIFGDYDVDGTTSVALMARFFRSIPYSKFITYIPDRYKEGYGISIAGMDFAKKENCGLIIALDCGIKAHEAIGHAVGLGLEVIVCDHHLPGENLPPAFAILDPKQTDCTYPFQELSGCGVGFKLCQGLIAQGTGSASVVPHLLDLLAISIAADIVPLIGENRVLAHLGVNRIRTKPSPGVQALMEVESKREHWDIADIVFGIAPKINACGRIESGNFAVQVLCESDFTEASKMARKVNDLNKTRREKDVTITAEALEMLEKTPGFESKKSTVIYADHWHKGVIGIVASRLIEKHYKPTIVLTRSNGVYTGSARSVSDFNIHEALEACSDLMEQFGGHKFAAGMSILPENMEAFVEKFEEVVCQQLRESQKVEHVAVCSKLSIQDITKKFWTILDRMEPFGPHNMRPVFCFEGLRCNGKGRVIGQNENHLKLEVYDASSKTALDAVGFNMAPHFNEVLSGQPFDALATVEANYWRGKMKLQLNFKDIDLNPKKPIGKAQA